MALKKSILGFSLYFIMIDFNLVYDIQYFFRFLNSTPDSTNSVVNSQSDCSFLSFQTVGWVITIICSNHLCHPSRGLCCLWKALCGSLYCVPHTDFKCWSSSPSTLFNTNPCCFKVAKKLSRNSSVSSSSDETNSLKISAMSLTGTNT